MIFSFFSLHLFLSTYFHLILVDFVAKVLHGSQVKHFLLLYWLGPELEGS